MEHNRIVFVKTTISSVFSKYFCWGSLVYDVMGSKKEFFKENDNRKKSCQFYSQVPIDLKICMVKNQMTSYLIASQEDKAKTKYFETN